MRNRKASPAKARASRPLFLPMVDLAPRQMESADAHAARLAQATVEAQVRAAQSLRQEPEILDRGDLKQKILAEADRRGLDSGDAGILFRFYEAEKERLGFKPTITRRSITNWLKRRKSQA